MITIYYKNIKENSLRVLDEFKIGSWLHVQNPTEAELGQLEKNLSLDPGLLRDALDQYEVPRVEVEGSVTYIYTRYPYTDQTRTLTAPILIAIGEDFFVTIVTQPFAIADKFIKGEVEFFTTQKTKLFLQFFFQVNTAYSIFLNNISRQIRGANIEFGHIENKDIIQFVTFEGILNDFTSALVPTNTMLQNLLSGKFLRLYKDDQDLIEDLFLNNGQLLETCNLGLKTIVNIRETYTTVLSNNLNRVLRLLTSLTLILTIPNLLINFFSMNVSLPFQHAPFAYVWLIAANIGMTLIMVAIFYFNRWL